MDSDYEKLLRGRGELRYQRLMYGEWLRDECEECHTKEHVRKYADRAGKEKNPIYLCDACAAPGMRHLRDWPAEE